jgi:hypothetical protein
MKEFDTHPAETHEFVAEWAIDIVPNAKGERRRSQERRRAERRHADCVHVPERSERWQTI